MSIVTSLSLVAPPYHALTFPTALPANPSVLKIAETATKK